jgi:hypothetical protein
MVAFYASLMRAEVPSRSSQPLAQDPGRNYWTRMNLSTENLGLWETTYDEERWKRHGVLQMLYQKLPGIGMDYGSQNDSTPVSVM